MRHRQFIRASAHQPDRYGLSAAGYETSAATANYVCKTIAALILGLILLIADSATTQSGEQLPINELDACEIVLHELIADLTRVQRTSRQDSANSSAEEPGLYSARHQATEEAFAQAIRLAKAKYARCP
jgi:hypothetical protein